MNLDLRLHTELELRALDGDRRAVAELARDVRAWREVAEYWKVTAMELRRQLDSLPPASPWEGNRDGLMERNDPWEGN